MDQWEKMLKGFDEWGSPLRPCLEDVQMFKRELKQGDRVLLLGVTEELIDLADAAVDNNLHAVQKGGSKAILADWGSLPYENEFDVIIGDGCLTVFQQSPNQFFNQMKKALKPRGRLVLRLFIAPEEKEDLAVVLKNKERGGFHSFKWRIAHSLAQPYVNVYEIYKAIQPVWNHPTLDVYRESDLVYYFPKLSEIPAWDRLQFGTSYELSERCPVVTWEMNSSNFPAGNCST